MAIFPSFGDQLQAVIRASLHGSAQRVDPRLLAVQQRAVVGGGERLPSDAGFLIEPEFVPALIQRMYMTGEILQRCSEMPISTRHNGVRFPQFAEDSRANGSRLGGVQAFFQEEGVAIPPSKPKFFLSEILANKMIALITVSDELLKDAASLETFVSAAFASEMSFVLEESVVNGTGVSGQPLGILNSGALISISKDDNQPAATITGPNVLSAVSRLWSASRKNAIWICNQEVLPQLMSLTVITGGSERRLFHFNEGDSSMPWDRLAGIPIVPTEHNKVPGETGDLILADFSRYLLARKQATSDVSIHVSFLSDELCWKFVLRCGGQPLDRLPVMPLYGTETTSPFVALAARS